MFLVHKACWCLIVFNGVWWWWVVDRKSSIVGKLFLWLKGILCPGNSQTSTLSPNQLLVSLTWTRTSQRRLSSSSTPAAGWASAGSTESMAPKIADDEEPGMWGDWAPKLLDFKVKQEANSLSAFFVGWFLRHSFFPGHGWILRAVFVRIENHIAWALNVCSEAAKVVWQWLILSQTTPCLHPLKYDQQMFREHCRDGFCQKKAIPFFLASFWPLANKPLLAGFQG